MPTELFSSVTLTRARLPSLLTTVFARLFTGVNTLLPFTFVTVKVALREYVELMIFYSFPLRRRILGTFYRARLIFCVLLTFGQPKGYS